MTEAILSRTTASHPALTEDWLAVVLGLLVFALAVGSFLGVDLLGWAVTTSVWTDFSKALAPAAKAYAWLGGAGALAVTFIVLLTVLSVGAVALGSDVRKFIPAFAVVFALSYASWILGSYASLAVVTPADQAKFGLGWSMKLTNEGGFLIALVAGLIIANFFPRFADWLKEAIRPELYIKIAIVILGAFIAVTAAGKLTLASSLLLRGLAAIIEAYLIYWSVVYFVARKYFGFSREWAAPLASGISICGVAAAISTGGAIRARPQVAVLVSSLVVVFAVIEVLVLPFVAQTFLSHEPLVAAAWLGLAVKTDGAAVAAGGITNYRRQGGGGRHKLPAGLDIGDHGDGESLHRRVHRRLGLHSRLCLDQSRQCRGRRRKGETVRNLAAFSEIHSRFYRDLRHRTDTGAAQRRAKPSKLTAAIGRANVFRVIFFILTFFSIGVLPIVESRRALSRSKRIWICWA